jgi:hypothetical protein
VNPCPSGQAGVAIFTSLYTYMASNALFGSIIDYYGYHPSAKLLYAIDFVDKIYGKDEGDYI